MNRTRLASAAGAAFALLLMSSPAHAEIAGKAPVDPTLASVLGLRLGPGPGAIFRSHLGPTGVKERMFAASPWPAGLSRLGGGSLAMGSYTVAQCGTPAAPGCGVPTAPAAAPPPPPAAPAYVRPTSRSMYPRRGLMITGWVMLGSSWLVASLIGAVQTDVCDVIEDSQCRTLGKMLIIPVAGPFVAMLYSESASQKWGLAVLGVSEVLGLIMGIIGTVQHVSDKRSAGRGVALGGGWRMDMGAVSSVRPGGLPTPTLQLSTSLR